MHNVAITSKAGSALETVRLPVGLPARAAHCTAVQGSARQRKAKQSGNGFGLYQFAFKPDPEDSGRFRSITMAIQQARIKITGIAPLLQNNPQTADPFNRYAKAKKAITKRTAKTES